MSIGHVESDRGGLTVRGTVLKFADVAKGSIKYRGRILNMGISS